MNAVEFGTLFQFIRNGMNVKQDKSGDGLPITRIETISEATVDATRVGYADLKESDCHDWLMKEGDILFSHINSVEHIGKCAVYRGAPEKLVHGMNLLCLRCDSSKLLPEFAKYLMRGSEFRTRLSNFINKAVNQASVSIGNLKTIPVRVPRLAEQGRIAEVLDRAEALRAKRRAVLAQLDTLIQSIFLDLFGDPIRNPRKWPLECLESFFHFRTGKLDSNAAVASGQFPFFTCSRENSRIDSYAFDCEALLLAGNNASADYSVKHYKGKFNAYQRTYVITLRNERNSYKYAQFVLEHRLAELKRISKGTNTKYLTMELLNKKDTKLTELLTGKAALDAELERLRAEIAAIKKQNAETPDTHNYSEAETRDYFIDLLLKEAGWPLDKKQDREYPVTGMPNEKGEGFVDYVLWGDDGKPLGLVEAKRTKRDARVGQQQAKLYADCLEKQFGQRPIIFYSNGYEHWIWDDQNYPPRSVQGFYAKDELERLIQRRTTRTSLGATEINKGIVERFYQERAIRRIGEAFEKDHERKALVVMATGAGKTRTVVALCDLMMRCNWVKRVLFLADRIALVKQTTRVFTRFLPSASAVNAMENPEQIADARVLVSTYPTMLRLIDETTDGRRKFGPGHFDLVVIDEAHRSVYQKYRAIFEYFDSFLVGLTATPTDEVDHNTYSLFELEDGVPTDAYGLEEAVRDKFLVPPRAVSVPLRFQREGMKYDQLSDEERERWDAIEWDEDGAIPRTIEPEALNRWLFNEDTVDKVLEQLMRSGEKVADGDRLGKTIIFAKNHAHAQFIADRFDTNYPHQKGVFARVIDFQVEYAQSLIDDFSNPARAPHIAISVDMLDTGIDIPEIVNLVFFKMVRSMTKFWQMVGRGTRLRPDLFGPGQHKREFWIFDYCQNLEFFSQNLGTTSGATNESLSKKLFAGRVELIAELDKHDEAVATGSLRGEVAERLRQEVAQMNVNNFIVRPKRRLVEKYADARAWETLGLDERNELVGDVAGLPSELLDEDLEAKQFDLLMLRLQLGLLRQERSFTRWSEDVRQIAGALEDKASIPMVRAELELIIEVQTDEFWQDITASMLEDVRKRLRSLVKFIDKTKRQNIYTDFADLIGEEREIDLPGFAAGHDVERFRDKTQQFLRAHESDPVIHKLRWNEPLSRADFDALEKILVEAGAGTPNDLSKVRSGSGLGLFVREMIGLDRQAAKRAFDGFLAGKTLTANQIEFVSLVIDYLTQSGWMRAAELYESPFTDFNPKGVDGMFSAEQVVQLIGVLDEIRMRAQAH